MPAGRILITGGAGFVGSNLAVRFKERLPSAEVFALDNLKRRGSELNVPRLREHGVRFVHGDVRNPEDLEAAPDAELIVECSAEPSVLAGTDGLPAYLLNTNLVGTINCLEYARRRGSAFIFLSTSRVYPYTALNEIELKEESTRLRWCEQRTLKGWSTDGVGTDFTLEGPKTLYGATKLCSELLIAEYVAAFGLRAVINRCGVVAGPWQFGKVDQGVFTYWMLAHYFRRPLTYIGFGGQGKQVRDLLHVADLFDLVCSQACDPDRLQGQVYSVGGGLPVSLSLLECTNLCAEITGHSIPIGNDPRNRPGDIPIFLSECGRTRKEFAWSCRRSAAEILADIFQWIRASESALRGL
jgi:CDP-paratose 2-epimerase